MDFWEVYALVAFHTTVLLIKGVISEEKNCICEHVCIEFTSVAMFPITQKQLARKNDGMTYGRFCSGIS